MRHGVWALTLVSVLEGCGRSTQPSEPIETSGDTSSGNGGLSSEPGEPELLYDLTMFGRPKAIHYHEGQLYFGVMTNTAYEFYQVSADGKGTPEKLGASMASDAGIGAQVLARTENYLFWPSDDQLVRLELASKKTEVVPTNLPLVPPDTRIVMFLSDKLAAVQRDCGQGSLFELGDMTHTSFGLEVPESQVPGGFLTVHDRGIYCPTNLRIVSFFPEESTQAKVEVEVPQREEGYKFGYLAVLNDQLYTVRSALRKNAIIERLDNGSLVHVATIEGAYQSMMVADEKRGVFFLADSIGQEHPIYKLDISTGTVSELVGGAQPAKQMEADENYLYWTTDNTIVPKDNLRSGIYRQSKDAPTR